MASRHAYSLGTHAVSASPLGGGRKVMILIELRSYHDHLIIGGGPDQFPMMADGVTSIEDFFQPILTQQFGTYNFFSDPQYSKNSLKFFSHVG